jgi:hypothetical protein
MQTKSTKVVHVSKVYLLAGIVSLFGVVSCDSSGGGSGPTGPDIPEGAIGISSVEELQNIGKADKFPLDGEYVIVEDIQADPTSDWNDGNGFEPIGSGRKPFTGILDGNGHIIYDININREDTSGVALISSIKDAKLRNVVLKSVDIKGSDGVGGLVGFSCSSEITRCKVNGSVVGTQKGDNNSGVGGLIGYSGSPTACYGESIIDSSSTSVTVKGIEKVGGLVGWNAENSEIRSSSTSGNVIGDQSVGGIAGANMTIGSKSNPPIIKKSFTDATVSGKKNVGGLAGFQRSGALISKSYSESKVSGENNVGGLAGEIIFEGRIKKSFSDGSISGNDDIGGLVGVISGGSVTNSYSKSEVRGGKDVGGAVGSVSGYTTISEVYSSGNVSGEYYVGGFIGKNVEATSNQPIISSGYWDIEATGQTEGIARIVRSGQGESGVPIGLTTDQITGESAENMDLDFQDIWQTVKDDYPALQWEE